MTDSTRAVEARGYERGRDDAAGLLRALHDEWSDRSYPPPSWVKKMETAIRNLRPGGDHVD